ncbi:hypothetical protein DDB_G0288743 [Dictyostelium discoideum AX4]|uniref:hypothetical protein n=1 Tax=Dictyostelium discoideum AX4 TaxID=352472 RepID=UPI00004E491B|nr:hypothetical protein DDB_G0288743 [Dictyostelium discoideum AX4]EAL63103.1 hypothetical protein DDB_G0288743 [Dictyostelium discoideum AX4]|eukprot:XP_636606.1 hypothetical protein DDB_G0288743 [Dictyostelium discoideum AX4]
MKIYQRSQVCIDNYLVYHPLPVPPSSLLLPIPPPLLSPSLPPPSSSSSSLSNSFQQHIPIFRNGNWNCIF